MPDFSFSHPTTKVRGLKALDYSLNRSGKDFKESQVGFDLYVAVSFDVPELTDPSLGGEGAQAGHWHGAGRWSWGTSVLPYVESFPSQGHRRGGL